MLRLLVLSLCLVFLGTVSIVAAPVKSAPSRTFGVGGHSNVTIEWWYVNAHVTTDKGRHLALIGSFFRFGNGQNILNSAMAQPRAHYLIYAVTDLDKKTHQSYSLADSNMVALMKQIAPLMALTSPKDKGTQAFLTSLQSGKLPSPSQEIAGKASVINKPFQIAYGTENTLAATNENNTEFTLNLNAGASADQVHLTLAAQKPPMAVGGKGETGLQKANDMYYFSLTRCAVGGTIDTGAGSEKIVGGTGWFDHQWGNSWVASNDGWDWWGTQLDNGTDILFFQQRDLSTGKTFFPLATFMDKNGHQTVTRKIVFTPDPKAVWKSPKSGVRYPLGWTVSFPEKHLKLHLIAAVRDQEMPILGPGNGIWEGLCHVTATQAGQETSSGVAYMELVGYNSPVVKAQMAKRR